MPVEEFLRVTLSPVAQNLAANGAAHIMLVYLPETAQMPSVFCNLTGKARAEAFRKLSKALDHAATQFDQPPKTSLILPPGVKP